MKDYSEPRMHTAEHLLNQTMVRMFGIRRAFSSHIERKKSKCDYRFGRDLAPAEKSEIERRVNEAARSDLRVTEEFISREEAERRYDLFRLPENAGDKVRVVHVGEYDSCPCIGAHAASTKEIGTFRIVSSSFGEGVLRLRFRLDGPG